MENDQWDVVVIGAGAAGMMAAIRAAECGRRTLLLEKNRKPGVKILMSGGTRCNITHATDNRGIVEAFGPPGKFLHSALADLSVEQTIAFFEDEGVATKVEETGKIFPVSNKAVDVLNALLARLRRSGAVLALEEPLVGWHRHDAQFLLTTLRRALYAANVILTVGGQSYPGSGTTGDGYRFAAELGHTIVQPVPALVPLVVDEKWVPELRGITIPDVRVRIMSGEHELAHRRGSLLFTHFGLSGPVVLDVSRVVSRHDKPDTLAMEIDFAPNESEAEFDERLRIETAAAGKRQLTVVICPALPRRLCDALLVQAGIDANRKAAGLSKVERKQILRSLKYQRLVIRGTLGFKKAEVTAGGIALGEVDSRTMRSKLVPGLFIAGEVLDLDGPIGGYNFQAAFSTGWLAGHCA